MFLDEILLKVANHVSQNNQLYYFSNCRDAEGNSVGLQLQTQSVIQTESVSQTSSLWYSRTTLNLYARAKNYNFYITFSMTPTLELQTDI